MKEPKLYPCHACGRMFTIGQLDAKPEPHNQPDPEGATDWTRLECKDCYGPGWAPGPEED